MENDGEIGKRTDEAIAQAVIHAFHADSLVPEARVTVEVGNGWVTLRGEVDWRYQHMSAAQCAQSLAGVRGVTNAITIKPRADAASIRRQITEALARQAEREARHIGIAIEGSVVTLEGRVHSLAEHDAILGTAAAAPGVSRVIDHLEVGA